MVSDYLHDKTLNRIGNGILMFVTMAAMGGKRCLLQGLDPGIALRGVPTPKGTPTYYWASLYGSATSKKIY